MSKNLTKNARWVIALVEHGSSHERLVINAGRWSYHTPESEALTNSIDFSKCKLIATYLVDVSIITYARDWEKASNLAEKHFINQKQLELQS